MSDATISNITVPIDVVLGETSMTIEELACLSSGSVFELPRMAGEPLEIRASGHTIALGEVVIVDERYAIRVHRMIEDQQRGTE